MREILFRGKRLGNDEWVEGDLRHGGYYLNDPDVYIVVRFADTVVNYPVAPSTVGQYTGLKDKNGKRIFEGDILKDDWGKIYEVIFTPYSCSFMVECTVAPHEYETGRYRMGVAWCNTIEIIGNIHDNPELMEVR